MVTRKSELPERGGCNRKFLKYCWVSSRVAAAIVFLIGALNLFVWFFDRTLLLRTFPHGVAIAASASFAFVLSGLSLWLFPKEADGRFPGILAGSGAFLVALLGFLNFTGYVTGWDPGIDRVLAREAGNTVLTPAARMSPYAALNFALLGVALLLARWRRAGFVASVMAMVAGIVSLLGVMSYAYEAEPIAWFGGVGPFAFQTALSGVFLAMGILFVVTDRGPTRYLSLDLPGCIMARRLMPAVVFIPVLFGLLRHWGEKVGLYRGSFGIALMVIFSIVALSVLVWWSTESLNRIDRERERVDRVRERHELELMRTAELLEKVFSNIHLKIAYLDTQFNIVRVNQAYADAAGHPPPFFVGKNHFDIYPDGEYKEIFRKVVETGESFAVSSTELVFPDHPEWGTTYWDWSLQPVKGKDGTVTGLILTLVNVTDKVRAENRLREKEEEAVRTGKMVLLGELAAGIAHEVRNPLSGLKFSLTTMEAMLNEVEGIDPTTREIIKRTITTSRAASERIEGVIRRVLDFARAGKTELEPIEINGAVREAMDLIAPMLRKNGIRVCMELSEGLPRCNANMRLIEQLVLNLANNAMNAMASRDGEKMIEITSRADGNRILLTVADSGPGVAESNRGKVFKPFFSTMPEGTGLGLSISHRIVSDHNGTIEIGTSRFGGAEFRISLPAAADCVGSMRT